MKRSRTYALVGLAAASSLILSACSDDTANNGSGGSGDAAAIECGSGDLNSSGSSAQGKAMDEWQAMFSGTCTEITVNYDGSGSGQGIKDFTAGLTDMAGSDSPLKDEEVQPIMDRCEGGNVVQVPMVTIPIAFVYNVQGVDNLNLSAEVIAKIFAGEITSWDNEAIKALNEGVDLPSTTITTVHRSKDSGTTDNMTKYLEAAGNGAWTFGTGKAWAAPGGQGAPDSAGIASAVSSTDGAISYVDSPDAVANKLKIATLDAGDGPVELNSDSVGKALEAAEVENDGTHMTLNFNYTPDDHTAYPAVMVAYEITCETGLGADKYQTVKSFLQYAVSETGQSDIEAIGFSTLPEGLRGDVEEIVNGISE